MELKTMVEMGGVVFLVVDFIYLKIRGKYK